MTRFSLAPLLALALAGCVVVPVRPADPPPPPPPPPPRVVEPVPAPEPDPLVWYHGPHFIPEDEGGGWCYEEGAHTHGYFPDHPEVYVVERGYYTYDGPSIFVYVGGHPLPGGGWCFLAGPHHHDYFPPPRAGFVWRRGHGYFYEGAYRPGHPPPRAFWPRAVGWHRLPPPAHLPAVPAPMYRPSRGAPQPPARFVVPPARPADRLDDRGRDRLEDRGRDRLEDRGRDRLEDRDRLDGRDRVRFDGRDHDRKDDRDRFDARPDDRSADDRGRDRRDDRDRLDGRGRDRRDGDGRATPGSPPPPPPGPARDDRERDLGRHGDGPKGGPAAAPGQQERAQPLPPPGKQEHAQPLPPPGRPGATDAAERARGGADHDRKDRKDAERKDVTEGGGDARPARPRR